jgi:hypothetical protein
LRQIPESLSIIAGRITFDALGNGHSNGVNLGFNIQPIIDGLENNILEAAKEGLTSLPIVLPCHSRYEPRATVLIDPFGPPNLRAKAIRRALAIEAPPQNYEEHVVWLWRRALLMFGLKKRLKTVETRTYVCKECNSFPDERNDCPICRGRMPTVPIVNPGPEHRFSKWHIIRFQWIPSEPVKS